MILSVIAYCRLFFFKEVIHWSKACIGSQLLKEVIAREVVSYEFRLDDANLRTVWTPNRIIFSFPNGSRNLTRGMRRVKLHLEETIPETQIQITGLADNPIGNGSSSPFRLEYDGSPYVRHKLNLIFSLHNLATKLAEEGDVRQAENCLIEALLIEPNAFFARDLLVGLRSK